MIADARDLESGFELECDVCIVGTGAAGLTLANFLNHTKVSVCLVESAGESGAQGVWGAWGRQLAAKIGAELDFFT